MVAVVTGLRGLLTRQVKTGEGYLRARDVFAGEGCFCGQGRHAPRSGVDRPYSFLADVKKLHTKNLLLRPEEIVACDAGSDVGVSAKTASVIGLHRCAKNYSLLTDNY
jgi:hypothetical protein